MLSWVWFSLNLGHPGEGPQDNKWWVNKINKHLADIRIGTANITAAGSLEKLHLEEAEVWAIKEHKLVDDETINRLKVKLGKQGWKSIFSESHEDRKRGRFRRCWIHL